MRSFPGSEEEEKKRVEGNKIKICERNYRTPESSDRERQEMTRACRESKQEERKK